MKLWDEILASGASTYTIGEVGHSENLTINNNNNFKAAIQVKTIGIEKANTIAIYETNGTVFNGHYQEQERMNIIQLYINDSGTGTPFEAGLNTIVIPTSLFTETIFNAHVQNETLSATPIYSADEEKFKFISVGREGNTEQACDEIDFVIIRFDISSEDAMEILDLLLTCLVNETNNQTGVAYSYVSTKLNGTSATMMNLPISVLQYIPWYCDFSDSPKGSKPQTFADWFWVPLIELGKAIIGIIFFIIMAIVLLVILIIKFFIDLFMEALPILQYILWLIIRVIFLIFVYIIFAITVLIIFFGFLVLNLLLSTLQVIFNFELISEVDRIEFQNDEIEFTLGYNIGSAYFEFFDINIPAVILYFDRNGSRYEKYLNFMIMDFQLPTNEIVNEIIDEIPSDPEQSFGLKTSDTSSSPLDMTVGGLVDFVNGFSLMIGLFGAIMCIAGGLYQAGPIKGLKEFAGAFITIISSGILGIGLALLFISIFTNPSSIALLCGMVIGIWIATKCINVADDLWDPSKIAKFFNSLLGDVIELSVTVIATILAIYELQYPRFKTINTTYQFGAGLFAIIAGTFAMTMITDDNVRDMVGGILILIGWIASIIIIIDMVVKIIQESED